MVHDSNCCNVELGGGISCDKPLNKRQCIDIFNAITEAKEHDFNEVMKRLNCLRDKAIQQENKKELLNRMANRKPY